MEMYKDVIGYEGRYEVSNLGSVRSIQFKGKAKIRQLSPCTNVWGYNRVSLFDGDTYKAKSVHRLVAQAFVANPDNKPDVNHLDGNKLNNRASNLEWVTKSENSLHRIHVLKQKAGGHNKRAVIKRSMGGELLCTYPSVAEAYNDTLIHHIAACAAGKRKSAGGYLWEYVMNRL